MAAKVLTLSYKTYSVIFVLIYFRFSLTKIRLIIRISGIQSHIENYFPHKVQSGNHRLRGSASTVLTATAWR